MTYNEADHPRDEKGRWTYAGGAKSKKNDDRYNEPIDGVFKLGAEINEYRQETPAQVLYKNSFEKMQKQKVEKEYRNILLDTLDKLATPAEVLYSNIQQLEKMVKENHLEKKLKQNLANASSKVKSLANNSVAWVKEKGREVFKKWIETQSPEELAKHVGTDYKNWKNNASKFFIGKDAAGMLDISHKNINDKSYLESVFKIDNYKDKRFEKYQNYLKDKLTQQFKHYGTNIDDIKGYYFGPNSKASQNMADDIYTQKYVKENKEGFLNNNLKKTSINFETGNMYYAHHLVDVIDYQFDSENNLELIISDTNDYNENDENKLVQAGDIAMKKDWLIPKFVIKHVIIPKENLEKLWGKY